MMGFCTALCSNSRMFSSSSLVKLTMFVKHKTGKTNKNIANTEEQSTVAALS